jgi:hypothetical protein
MIITHNWQRSEKVTFKDFSDIASSIKLTQILFINFTKNSESIVILRI